MPADPRGLAARPAFAQFLAALRGGEEPCPCCRGVKPAPCNEQCACSGSGRAAVPPDLSAAHMAADWWQEQGGDLPGMLAVYAKPPEWLRPTPTELHALPAGTRGRHDPRTGRNYVIEPPESDDSLRPALLALTERDDDPRVRALAVAARGLRVERVEGEPGEMRWCVVRPPTLAPAGAEWHPNEPAARLALKRGVLSLYDPLVRVPCRAEGARLTMSGGFSGVPNEVPLGAIESGRRVVPFALANEYRLDGVRLGAPPDWSWAPHALPGGRLAVTWDAAPSSLLPAAADRWDELGESERQHWRQRWRDGLDTELGRAGNRQPRGR